MLTSFKFRFTSPQMLTLLLVLQAPLGHAQSAPAAVAPPAVGNAASDERALAARIDSEIAPLFKVGEPGAAIIVTRGGRTLFRKAYGMADVAKGEAMTPHMVMRIASITKQFTATGILMLADEGKLALDDDIRTYFPDYAGGGKRITIEHLLSHTSGIANFTSKPGFVAEMGTDRTVGQMIDSFKNDPLKFDPGTAYAYSNSNYFLLGAIIEKVSGLSYATFVEQRIFVPLGMANTAYDGHERGDAVRAKGYSRDGGGAGFDPAKAISMTLPYAAGALVSTVDDLARWDAAVSTGALLHPATQRRAFTAYTLSDGKSSSYGYGWSLRQLGGMSMQAHGGGINGYSSYALRLPEQALFVAILTNADSGIAAADKIALKVAAIAVGKPLTE